MKPCLLRAFLVGPPPTAAFTSIASQQLQSHKKEQQKVTKLLHQELSNGDHG